MYGIENTEENFEKLREVIKERNFIIYRRILYMIDNCQVIAEDSTGVTIEIDLFEHRKLLEDLINSFFTKKISTRKVEKQIEHAYIVGNPFLTIKIYNGFKQTS